MPVDHFKQFRHDTQQHYALFDINPDHPSSLCCVCDGTVKYNDDAVIVRGMDTQHIAHKKCASSINRY